MQKESKVSSLIKRHIVGALFLPVFFAYLYYLPPSPYFFALLLIVAVIALRELFTMYNVPAAVSASGIVTGAALLYAFCYYPEYYLESIFAALCLLLLIRLLLIASPSGCMSHIGPVVTGYFYVAFFLSFQWLLRFGDNGLEYIFMLYISVWLADSMAYYIGSSVGRHKLYPSVSPNKTVEGAVGSLIGGMAGVFIVKTVFHLSVISTFSAVMTGIMFGVAALAGDLVESMLKRDAGVKDSGAFIPGHGGILDKIDGFLVSGPVLYFMTRYF
ncbi:MAG: phosphatidate cytidylyltransferase [Nitrospiraceae bacterium]|nr:MAG: phosphatidate cytidylyltransferase [Nitrospiraceae bacterium]